MEVKKIKKYEVRCAVTRDQDIENGKLYPAPVLTSMEYSRKDVAKAAAMHRLAEFNIELHSLKNRCVLNHLEIVKVKQKEESVEILVDCGKVVPDDS